MANGIIQFKKMFFDSKQVLAATDKAARSVLSKIGAFIRREAKSSIRPGGTKHKASLPGPPPRSQTGLFKRFIFFGYDTSAQSVVVGPAKLGGVKGKDAPHALEYGGKTVLGPQTSGFSRSVTIAKRPYMGPSLNKNLPKLPAMWVNSIKK
jgi:hypothetical protein